MFVVLCPGETKNMKKPPKIPVEHYNQRLTPPELWSILDAGSAALLDSHRLARC